MSSNGDGARTSNGDGAGDQSAGRRQYERVLVGTDGSPTAGRAVDRAVEVAQAHGARLTILSAGRNGEEVVAAEAARHQDSGMDIELRPVQGDPSHALVTEARDGGYDLLVVGNKGLSGIRRLNPLGSVPGKISHHIPCTLLVVKTT